MLLIGTHMDVVDAGETSDWIHDPFGGVVEDGRVWGRGACDAKNAMAAQVFAARALADTGVRMRGTLLLIASVDDEGRFDRLKWPGMTYLAERGLRARLPFRHDHQRRGLRAGEHLRIVQGPADRVNPGPRRNRACGEYLGVNASTRRWHWSGRCGGSSSSRTRAGRRDANICAIRASPSATRHSAGLPRRQRRDRAAMRDQR